MRAIGIGIVAAVVLAVAAAMILDGGFQRSAEERHLTQGVRL